MGDLTMTVQDPEDEAAPCVAAHPCKDEYQSDDDLCCAHGGMCQDDSHPHHDREEYAEWLIDGYVERESARRFRATP